MEKEILYGAFGIVSGIVAGGGLYAIYTKLGLNKSRQEADNILREANSKSENILRKAVLDGKTQVHDLKVAAEKEIMLQKNEMLEVEKQLNRREGNIEVREKSLTKKEEEQEKFQESLNLKLAKLEAREIEVNEALSKKTEELERIANLTTAQAKEELFEIVKAKMNNEVTAYLKEAEEEEKVQAKDKANNIIVHAIQSVVNDVVMDRSVSVISLPNDEMKGRIIGKEGRNIKTFEKITGVDVIIDDTPETLVLSCYNPIRREVARLALEALIADGRIQPGRIEEVVARVERELEEHILKTGEETAFKLRLGKMPTELLRLIGRLKYRYSYSQNALQHSIEVAQYTGIMAAELGLNQTLAKRAGLLHDIGKALDFEQDGTHTELGYKVCKKLGEHPIVLNAILAHHEIEPPIHLISNLVCAADVLSASRPGARKEAMQSYVERIEALENISMSFDGVKQAYAIQSGKELRIMVVPSEVDDNRSYEIARAIKERIENELTYPGNIKINVIRELRAIEVAK